MRQIKLGHLIVSVWENPGVFEGLQFSVGTSEEELVCPRERERDRDGITEE